MYFIRYNLLIWEYLVLNLVFIILVVLFPFINEGKKCLIYPLEFLELFMHDPLISNLFFLFLNLKILITM